MGSSRPRFGIALALLAGLAARSYCAESPRSSGAPAGDEPPSWTVGVAAFDVSRLGTADRLAGDLVVRTLAKALFAAPRRALPEDERQAYAGFLAGKNMESASKTLAAKRGVRDALLFAGNPEWKYRTLLEKADEDVSAAREAFDASVREMPRVAAERPLAAAKENKDGAFFEAPAAGSERSFCLKRSYDALLLGRVEPFYGRLYVALRLYSPYLDVDLYADSVAFSPMERDAALSELSLRLVSAASGSPPATLSVAVEPEDAGVHVDGVLMGEGSVGPLERVPGSALVSADREGYERFERRVEIPAGERTSVSISLPRAASRRVSVGLVDGEGKPVDGSIRLDGLYAGISPLELEIPVDRSSFVQGDADKRRSGAAVLAEGSGDAVSLVLAPALPKDATPVEDSRRAFYGAFGRFSLAMPLAFIVSGMATSYATTAVYEDSTVLSGRSAAFQTAGAVLWTVAGAFLAESAYRLVRYLRSSDSRSVKRAGVR